MFAGCVVVMWFALIVGLLFCRVCCSFDYTPMCFCIVYRFEFVVRVCVFFGVSVVVMFCMVFVLLSLMFGVSLLWFDFFRVSFINSIIACFSCLWRSSS